jgi:hypothetical protein
MSQSSKHLTSLEAIAKADECRSLMLVAAFEAQRVMLEHIAEVWERMARQIDDPSQRPSGLFHSKEKTGF